MLGPGVQTIASAAVRRQPQSTPRDRAQVGRLFEGLDLVEPGLVRVPEWRPAMAIDAGAPARMWAGVALKQ